MATVEPKTVYFVKSRYHGTIGPFYDKAFAESYAEELTAGETRRDQQAPHETQPRKDKSERRGSRV